MRCRTVWRVESRWANVVVLAPTAGEAERKAIASWLRDTGRKRALPEMRVTSVSRVTSELL